MGVNLNIERGVASKVLRPQPDEKPPISDGKNLQGYPRYVGCIFRGNMQKNTADGSLRPPFRFAAALPGIMAQWIRFCPPAVIRPGVRIPQKCNFFYLVCR